VQPIVLSLQYFQAVWYNLPMYKAIVDPVWPVMLFLCFLRRNSYAADLTLNAPAQVYFGPKGGPTQAIIKEIDDNKSETLVKAYFFTSAPTAAAL
jgi:hypothetical protein